MTGPGRGAGRVRCLSFHAGYGCGRTGACCTAEWPIPVEADRLAALHAALASGRLRPARRLRRAPFDEANDAAAPATLAHDRGGCVFLASAGGHTCRIQGALGHEALPLACRQFPRVSVHDPRGTSITLSHFCPTAASLLDSDEPVRIRADAPAFPAGGEYAGLDAREALPPLLAPDLLMDWEAWWAWEHQSVALLMHAPGTIRDALGRLDLAVRSVQQWRPGRGTLTAQIAEAFARALDPGAPVAGWRLDVDARVAEVTAAIPAARRPRVGPPAPETRLADGVARRFAAAHAFANWTAHLGRGLRTWARSVEAAVALLSAGFGVREADLRLRHLADPGRAAAIWSAAEAAPGRYSSAMKG